MTIKSCLELLAQADATIQDNTSGDITAAEVRALFKDIIDTFMPAYGVINCTSRVETLSATPAVLAPFTSVLNATTGYYTANLTNGSITRSRQGAAGCTDFLICDGAVEGPQNNLVNVSIFKNGAPTGFEASVTTQGAGRPVEFNIAAIAYSDTDPTYDVRVSGDTGNKTFVDVTLLAQAQAVRSFV